MKMTTGIINDVCKALSVVFPEDVFAIMEGKNEQKHGQITNGFPGVPFEKFMLDMWDEDPEKIREKFFMLIIKNYSKAE